MRISSLLATVLEYFIYLLIARVIVDYIRIFKRDWRPRGIILVVVESIYSITDPPMRLLSRYIPPLRLGGVSLDLSFIVLFMAVRFLQQALLLSGF